MKRSPLSRKTPLASGPGPARKPMKRKPKRKATTDKRWRSPEYLAWVRARPCAFCGLGPSDAHHVIGLGWGLSGMGLTAPDSYAMPICRVHHDAVHRSPGLQSQQPTWLRWTIRAALAARNAGFGTEAREELTHALAFIESKEAQ